MSSCYLAMLSYLSRYPKRKFRRVELAKEVAKIYGYKHQTVTAIISKITVRPFRQQEDHKFAGKELLVQLNGELEEFVRPVENIIELYNEKVIIGVLKHDE